MAPPPPDPDEASIAAHESRNILVLAAHQIAVRVAWIFRTESVIIPSFVDAITVDGAAWVRAWLPVLNNLCQSFWPLMVSHQLAGAPQKKWAMSRSTMLMGVPFLIVAGIWFALDGERPKWLPPLFLLLYSLHFAFNGVNVVSFTTLQGKLIRPERRGRLMALSGTGGAVLAIAAALLWLGPWLSLPDSGYGQIFLFTGAGFAAAGLMSLFVVEPRTPSHADGSLREPIGSIVARMFRSSSGFRRLCVASMLCFSAQLLFPHYQALGREMLGLEGREMMWWVIAQNAGTGVFAWWIGGIADRSGNRRALAVQTFVSAATPVLALFLAYVRPDYGRHCYWLVFGMLGLTPVTLRTLLNYTLELAPPEDHTRAVATMRLCMGAWLCLSPLLGVLIETTGTFVPVFLLVAGLLIGAGLWTMRVPEPRLSAEQDPIAG